MIRQSRPTVLLTRPLQDATRFAARLDGPVMISPLAEVRFLAVDVPQAAAVIFTSANAVAALRGGRPAARAWCVGDRTAQAARQAGFAAVSAGGDAEALLAAILDSGDRGPLVHPRGRDSLGDLAGRLSAAGIPAIGVVVYELAPLPLSADARALLEGCGTVIAPLFSPASARRFHQVVAGTGCRLVHACLSAAVARAVPGGIRHIAARPDADAMVDLIAALQGLETSPMQS